MSPPRKVQIEKQPTKPKVVVPELVIDKALMVDSGGRLLTQSLFLESAYDIAAIYTFKEYHHTWNDKVFYSLKKLYVDEEDPTEYTFANKYLVNWRHWERFLANKVIRTHIDEWRSELEYRLRAKAVKMMVESAEGGNYQAAKWLADRGWATRPAGRPSKSEVEGERAVQARLGNEYGADVIRLMSNQGK